MKDNSTGIASNGKSVVWARAERSRDGVTMPASGSWGNLPEATALADPAAYEAAVHDYAKKISGQIPESATFAIQTADIIFRCLKFPTIDHDEIASMAANQMEKDAPLPVEEMVGSFEILSSSEDASLVLCASAPIASVERLKKETGANLTQFERVDATALGLLRNLVDAKAVSGIRREAVLAEEGDRITLIVTDSAQPVLIRSAGLIRSINPQALVNTTRIAMIQTQIEHGASDLTHVICVSDSPNVQSAVAAVATALGCPVKHLATHSLPPVAYGTALRSLDESGLNLFPESWREMLSERQFRKHFRTGMMIAAASWLLILIWFYGWPAIITQRIKSLNAEVARLAPAETAVNDIRNRIHIIDRYSDRTYSPMEALLEVAVNLPEGIELSSFRYNSVKHQISVEGRAKVSTIVYDFMNRLKTSKILGENKLVSGPTLNRNLGLTVFELSIEFKRPGQTEEPPK